MNITISVISLIETFKDSNSSKKNILSNEFLMDELKDS
jgi:hypothetical protein